MKTNRIANLSLVVLLCSIGTIAQSGSPKPPLITPKNTSELEYRMEEVDRIPDKDIRVKLTKIKSSSADKTVDYKLKVELKANKGILLDVNLSELEKEAQIEAILTKPIKKTTMCGEIASVSIAQIGATREYSVEAEYIYDRVNHKIKVPKGFIYDRASIPRILWLLISPDDLGNVAPLLHDYLYRSGGKLPNDHVDPYRTYDRLEADDLFLEAMTKCGVDKWRREAAYQAVRLASEFAWKKT